MGKYSAKGLLTVFLVLASILWTAAFTAGEGGDDGYTVKKGDTLWNISSDMFKDPFSWTTIWEANPQIKDPHWIYPGQKLAIPPASDASAKADKAKTEEAGGGSAASVKASPAGKRGANALAKQKVPKLPVTERSLIVSKAVFMESGYIVSDIPAIGNVISSPEGRTIMGAGDSVYLEIKEPVADNSLLYVISKPEELTKPGSDVPIGYVVRIKGTLRTVGKENNYDKGFITVSSREILTGDLLARYVPVDPPMRPLSERRPPIAGTVIKIREDRKLAGRLQIVYLDMGSTAGVQVGDVFGVVSARTPHVPVGTLNIINTSPSASIAVIGKTVMEVTLGDMVGN